LGKSGAREHCIPRACPAQGMQIEEGWPSMLISTPPKISFAAEVIGYLKGKNSI
jgi:hypothetical protein